MARLQINTTVPDITLDAFVPEHPGDMKNRSLPVLWLLHGAEGHSSDWFRFTQIELFAQEKGIIVVCPSAGSGFYVNGYRGVQWGDIITEKLWGIVHGMLPTSDRPEDNFVAGNSMGGYGAMLLGLSRPDRFSKIGCFSGGVEIPQQYARGELPFAGRWGFADSFGPAESVIGGKNDLYALAKRRSEEGDIPEIYMCCGLRDEHETETNPRFRDYLRSLGYSVTWSDGDYAHEWRFWNVEIEKFLNWI